MQQHVPLEDMWGCGMGTGIPLARWGSSLEGERAEVGEAQPGCGDSAWGDWGEFGRVDIGVRPPKKAVGSRGPEQRRSGCSGLVVRAGISQGHPSP